MDTHRALNGWQWLGELLSLGSLSLIIIACASQATPVTEWLLQHGFDSTSRVWVAMSVLAAVWAGGLLLAYQVCEKRLASTLFVLAALSSSFLILPLHGMALMPGAHVGWGAIPRMDGVRDIAEQIGPTALQHPDNRPLKQALVKPTLPHIHAAWKYMRIRQPAHRMEKTMEAARQLGLGKTPLFERIQARGSLLENEDHALAALVDAKHRQSQAYAVLTGQAR